MHTRSPPPLPLRSIVHLSVAHSRHLPASAACICSPRRIPASSAVSRVHSAPLFRPCPSPRSMSSPGGFARRGSLCFRVSPVIPPYMFPCLLESSGVWFLSGGQYFVRERGQGAFTPWQFLAPVLDPPLGCTSAVQTTPHPSPLPTPLFVLIPSRQLVQYIY